MRTRVSRQVLADDDLTSGAIAPAGGPAGKREEADGEAKLDGQRLESGQDVGVGVARDRLGWRLERDQLRVRQRLCLRDVEGGREAEERLAIAGLLARGGVALLDAHRCPDVDRLLALAHAPVEREPGSKAGNARGVRALMSDHQGVAERVGMKARAGPDPACPTLA